MGDAGVMSGAALDAMTLSTAQVVTGTKTYQDQKLILRNPADTFSLALSGPPITANGIGYLNRQYTYLIFKIGSTYYSQNGQTLATTSGSNFATLLNATIAACSDGDCVAIAPGSYTRTAQIDILKNNFTLLGLGRVVLVSTTNVCGIKAGDGTNTYTGIRIENIRIDMGGYVTSSNDFHGIWVQKVNDFIITHCDVGNSDKGHAFRSAAIIIWDCIRGEISFNSADNFSNGIVVGSTTAGTTSEGVRVIGNRVHDIDPYDCITIYRSAGKCTVTGNHCYNGFYSGILIEGGAGFRSDNTTVTGNVCHDTQYGVFIYGGQKVAVTGNVCYNNTNFGINVRSSASTEVAISGNTVYNATNAGIHIGDTSQRGSISGNNVTECLHGLQFDVSSHYWNITGNHFHFNDQYGILIDASSDLTFIGNTIAENSQATHNTYSDVRLQNTATKCLFLGNKFPISGATTNKSKYGIEEASTTETANLYYNNYFSTLHGTGKLLISSTTSKARANENHRTENSGTFTASGNASTTVFSITHSLVTNPTWATVVPSSVDARGNFVVTNLGAATIQLTYPTAPPTGSSNLTWNWTAGVYGV